MQPPVKAAGLRTPDRLLSTGSMFSVERPKEAVKLPPILKKGGHGDTTSSVTPNPGRPGPNSIAPSLQQRNSLSSMYHPGQQTP